MNSLVFDCRFCRTSWFVSFCRLFCAVAAWCYIDLMPQKSVFDQISTTEFCLGCVVLYRCKFSDLIKQFWKGGIDEFVCTFLTNKQFRRLMQSEILSISSFLSRSPKYHKIILEDHMINIIFVKISNISKDHMIIIISSKFDYSKVLYLAVLVFY